MARTATIPAASKPTTSIAAPPHTSRWTRWNGLAAHPLVLGLLASLPLLVGAAVDAAQGWLPSHDEATIVLRAHSVFSGHTPLVGQFSLLSEYSGHPTYSPGPLLYWLLAIPAHFTRWAPAAPLLWMALFQSLVIVAIVWLADRIGGAVLATGSALGIVVLAYSIGPRFLYDPSNAYAPVLPLVLLVFTTAAIVTGRHRLLPLAVLVASFEVQADPSFVVIGGTLGVLALGACVVAWRRARAVDWLTLGLTVAVAVACWLPVMIQQVTTSRGNLTLLLRASHRQGRRQGAAFGLTILAKATAVWPFNKWVDVPIQGNSHVSAVWVLAGLLILATLAALVVWSLKRRAPDAAATTGAALVLAAGVVFAAAAVPDDSLGHNGPWLLFWTRAAGMVLWVVVVWNLWRLWGQRIPVRWIATAGAALITAGALLVAAVGRTPDPQAWSYPVIRRAAAVIEQRPGRGPYKVMSQIWPYVPLVLGQGLIERLAARGYHAGANTAQLDDNYKVPEHAPSIMFTSNPDPTSGRSTRPPPFAKPLFAMPVDMWVHGRRAVVTVWLRELH